MTETDTLARAVSIAGRQHLEREPVTTAGRLPLTLLLANPRGFCAGVDRAIAIVKEALAKNGPPIYVRHEIVHNRHVVDELRAKGAVFVDELDQVPDDGIVVFSAHGVPRRVPGEAKRRQLIFADATCPLVSKVHREVERHCRSGRTVLLIGHAGHPEVEGTMGQVPEASVRLVETVADAQTIQVPDPANVAFATQTTLSVTDTAAIVKALKARFPAIEGPRSEDICYATTNRQEAVAVMAPKADLVLVVGAPNSSNSVRLVEVALDNGAARAALVQTAADIDWQAMDGIATVGLTAGASAPEILVEEVIDAFKSRFDVTLEIVHHTDENVTFRVPPIPARKLASAS